MNYQDFSKNVKGLYYKALHDKENNVKFYFFNNDKIAFVINNKGSELYSIKATTVLDEEDIKQTVDFLAQNPKEWFKKIKNNNAKYNVVIGAYYKYLTSSTSKEYKYISYSAYAKSLFGISKYAHYDDVDEVALKSPEFQFTYDEIEELKSTLPTKKLREIVDLGTQEAPKDSFFKKYFKEVI